MRKFWKGLRYFLCYVAITLATATGVVVFSTNNSGNVNNNNLGLGDIVEEENNLMEVVSGVMSMEHFNLDSSVALTTPDSTNVGIDIDFDITLSPSITASGNLKIATASEIYDIDISFVDNTFYLSTLGQDLKFTTDGVISGIAGVLSLVDINLPVGDMEEFDVTSLLGFMGAYKETETENGYNISLEFMGYDIAMVCDKNWSLQSVSVEDMAFEGFAIDFGANLNTLQTPPVIQKPEKEFVNLDIITSLMPMVEDFGKTNFLSADFEATYNDFNLSLNAKADFNDTPKVIVSMPKEERINFAFINNTLYSRLGNIKVCGDYSTLHSIIDFVTSDLKTNINKLDANMVANVTEKATTATNSLAKALNNLNINKIFDCLDYLTLTDNQILIDIPNIANIVINKTENTITNLLATVEGITFEIKNISFKKQTLSVNTSDYVDFDLVFPTIEKMVNTVFTQGIGGKATFFTQDSSYTLNYGLKYNTHFETSFDTTLLNKKLSLVTDNAKAYFAFDGIKVNVDFAEYQDMLDYINKNLNQNITLPAPDLSSIDLEKVAGLSLGLVDYLQPTSSGVEFGINGITIRISCGKDYLENITIIYDDYTLSLSVTNYGDVNLFEIEKDSYITFEDLTNYIEHTKTFIASENFDMKLGVKVATASELYTANLEGKASTKGLFEGNATLDLKGKTSTVDLTLTKDALGLSYEGLDIYAKQSLIGKVDNLLNNIIPNYIDLSATLANNGINTTKQLALPKLDIMKLIACVDSISLTKYNISFEINLSNYSKNLNATLRLTFGITTGGYKLKATAYYDDIAVLLTASLNSTEEFTPVIKENAINVEDYVDFVETLDNTISTSNLNFGITANIDNYTINANLLADFRDGLKAQLTSNNLGSNLNIKYSTDINKLLIKLGNLKISGKYEDIDSLLAFVKGDLNNTLTSYGIKVMAKVASTLNIKMPKVKVGFNDIKDILQTITFEGNTISFVKDGINITLTKANNKFTNIFVSYDNYSIRATVEPNTTPIVVSDSGYVPFENVLTNLQAIENSVKTKALGGKVTVTYKGKPYTGNILINYINNTLAIHATTKVYGQDISITLFNKTLYVKVNDLKLQVAWEERNDLINYLNTKFGLDINIEPIIEKVNSLLTSKKAFDLKDINVDMISNFSATQNGLSLTADTIPVITTLGQYKTLSELYLASIFTRIDNYTILLDNMVFGEDAIVPNLTNTNEFKGYETFTAYFDEIERLISASKNSTTDQYTLRGSAKLYEIDNEGNAVTIDKVANEINITFNELKFDATQNTFIGGLDAFGSGKLYTDYLGGYDHSFDAAYDYNFIYFDYNGMKIKFSKQSNKEFITNLKTAIPHYIESGKLQETLVEVLDMVKFDTTGNMILKPIKLDKAFDMIDTIMPMLSTLRLESDNSITIGVNISKFAPSFKEELLMNLKLDSNNKLAISITNFKLKSNLALDFTLYVDTIGEFDVLPQGSFMDMTTIGKLLGAFDKTAQKTTTDNQTYKLNLSGTAHMQVEVLSFEIDNDIPFNAQVVIDRNKAFPIDAKITLNMPSIMAGIVCKASTTTMYLTDRLEGVPILYINRTGSDSVMSKYKASELGNNLINVIADATGISTFMLEQMLTNIKYIEGPSKIENILKTFASTQTVNSQNYTIGLDLRQLTLMEMMVGYSDTNKTTISIGTNKTEFTSIGFNNVSLEAISGVFVYLNGMIDLTNISKSFDFYPEMNSINVNDYGTWDDGSLTVFFEENGGSEVNNKMGTTGRSVALPTPKKEILNGNVLEVYEFLGWSLNTDLSGTLYTDYYQMGQTSVTMYAKWSASPIETYTKYTVSFVDTLFAPNNTVTITDYEGYSIAGKVPTKPASDSIHDTTEGKTTFYTFLGWYKGEIIDGKLTYTEKVELNDVIPGENMTLYANWREDYSIYQRLLQIIDPDKETPLYTGHFVDGEQIDITSYIANLNTTLWYTDSNYTTEILRENLPTTMPTNDLNIYVRNKYTLTFKSAYGDTTTKTISLYQRETLVIPTQNHYERTINSADGNPSYLASYMYCGYYDADGNSATTLMPRANKTYNAEWEYTTTSYVLVTFDVSWKKPSWWTLSNGSVKDSATAVDSEYVLVGSTLNNTTLTKKNSILGLAEDTIVSKYSTCKYKYGVNYSFEAVGWNTTGVQNIYDDSYSSSLEITQATSFYVVWGHK